MTTAIHQIEELASSLEADFAGVQTQVQKFPSGGAMLDVRRADGRMFVMSYSPTHGFGVDQPRPEDGFTTDFRFTCTEFEKAADQIRGLVVGHGEQKAASAVVALGLLVLYSSNIEASRHFYHSLGLTFATEKHGTGPQHYAAKLGTTTFEIYPQTKQSGATSSRLGFQLPSVEPVLEHLKRQSVSVVSELKTTPWGKRAVVKDPDGNFVELVEA